MCLKEDVVCCLRHDRHHHCPDDDVVVSPTQTASERQHQQRDKVSPKIKCVRHTLQWLSSRLLKRHSDDVVIMTGHLSLVSSEFPSKSRGIHHSWEPHVFMWRREVSYPISLQHFSFLQANLIKNPLFTLSTEEVVWFPLGNQEMSEKGHPVRKGAMMSCRYQYWKVFQLRSTELRQCRQLQKSQWVD